MLVKTSFEVDVAEGADLTTIRDQRVRLAVRVRRARWHKHPYWYHVTLRHHSSSNSLTELEKIISGLGDVLFFGFAADETSDQLSRWFLIDLNKFRLFVSRCFQDATSLGRDYGYEASREGDRFVWFDVLKFPDGVLLGSKVNQYSMPLPASTTFGDFVGAAGDRRRIYNALSPILNFYQYRIDREMTIRDFVRALPALKIEPRVIPPGLIRESMLYNVVSTRGGVPVFAVVDRPIVKDVSESWYVKDMLESELRNVFYQRCGFPALTWGRAFAEAGMGAFVCERYLVDEVRSGQRTYFGIRAGDDHPDESIIERHSDGEERSYINLIDEEAISWEELMSEDGATAVETWRPARDVENSIVILRVLHLSSTDAVFAIGRCHEFSFGSIGPVDIADYLSRIRAHSRLRDVMTREGGSDRNDVIDSWRWRMKSLGSSPY